MRDTLLARNAREMADTMEELLADFTVLDRDRAHNAPAAAYAREWEANRRMEQLEDALRVARTRLGVTTEELQPHAA